MGKKTGKDATKGTDTSASKAATPGGAQCDAVEELAQLAASHTAELMSKFHRLDRLLGEKHWVSVGSYKESILRNHLRRLVPQSFGVDSGFTISYLKNEEEPEKRLSKQIDILIWDSTNHTALFKDEGFVVIPAHACRAAIEVKGMLRHEELREGIANLDAAVKSVSSMRECDGLYLSLFAYDVGKDVNFPDSIFNALHAYYLRDKDWSLMSRLEWTRREITKWSMPWINAIVAVGHGVVILCNKMVNGEHYPCYQAFRTEGALDASCSLLGSDILSVLRVSQFSTGPDQSHVDVQERATASMFTPIKEKGLLLISAPEKVTSVGFDRREDPDRLACFEKWLYRPRRPRETKETKRT